MRKIKMLRDSEGSLQIEELAQILLENWAYNLPNELPYIEETIMPINHARTLIVVWDKWAHLNSEARKDVITFAINLASEMRAMIAQDHYDNDPMGQFGEPDTSPFNSIPALNNLQSVRVLTPEEADAVGYQYKTAS